MYTSTNDIDTTKKKLKKFISSYRYDIYGWSVFLFYEIVMVGLYLNHFGHPIRYIVNYILNIGLFYFHSEFTMREGLKNKSLLIFLLPLLLALEIIAYTSLVFVTHWYLANYTNFLDTKTVTFNYQFVISTVFRAFYFIVFSTGYYFLKNYLSERRKTEKLEQDRLQNLIQIMKSESAYLRAQINPHFLFNTLDFIYHNARETAPIAAESISALAEIMRYAIGCDFDETETLLRNEITQVESLINLHQLREDHELSIYFFYDEDVVDIPVIPLILVTIVENMFKHGDLRNSKTPGRIDIFLEDQYLIISTSNLISKNKMGVTLHSGIKNITKRLAYMYGNSATLNIDDKNHDIYSLQIKIERPYLKKSVG